MKFFTVFKILVILFWILNQSLCFYLQVNTDWISIVGSFCAGFLFSTLIPEKPSKVGMGLDSGKEDKKK